MLAIVPMGKIRPDILEYLRAELKENFNEEVKILTPIKIPQKAYSASRKQYNGKNALKLAIPSSLEQSFHKILVVTNEDLYIPELNFVFGVVEKIGGEKGIMSIKRLEEKFYTRPQDKKLFFSRALKEATHELGHLCGIPHCRNSQCVMYFSNSILDTDAKNEHFCNACKITLTSKVKT